MLLKSRDGNSDFEKFPWTWQIFASSQPVSLELHIQCRAGHIYEHYNRYSSLLKADFRGLKESLIETGSFSVLSSSSGCGFSVGTTN